MLSHSLRTVLSADPPVRGLIAPDHSIPQLARDRRHEPPQAVLYDVVVRPRPHCRYRHLLAESAGNEDKGNIELALVQQCQRLGTAEAGHRVIADRKSTRLNSSH